MFFCVLFRVEKVQIWGNGTVFAVCALYITTVDFETETFPK